MARLLTIVSLALVAAFAGTTDALRVGAQQQQLQPPQPKAGSPLAATPEAASTAKFPLRALPANLNITSSTFTVSGISAGSAMAVQFEIAFSALVKASGTIAGVPYMCAQAGGSVAALSCMSSPYMIDSDVLLGYVDTYSKLGTIDSPTNMKSHMTMVFSGLLDTVVKTGTVMVIDEMYKSLGVAKRYHEYNISAEHSWVTNDFGEACTYLGSPYINDCDYDFAGVFLNSAFNFLQQGPLNAKGAYNPSNLFKIDQTIYGANALISMDVVAFVYVPTACQSGNVQCHLHVNFHGCNQQRTAFPLNEDNYVGHTGLNKWAETNKIVIIYPQTIASIAIPLNPQGCFDWWGYTNLNFAQQAGLQMQVVRKMIRGIAGW